MIEISYHDGDSQANVSFNNDASLMEILSGVIKICKFAGYSNESFDRIVMDYAEEVLNDRGVIVPEKEHKDSREYSFEDFLFDSTIDY